MKDYRSAKTGRYMKKEEALEDKTTSVAETRKRRAPKKPKKEKPNEEVNVQEVENESGGMEKPEETTEQQNTVGQSGESQTEQGSISSENEQRETGVEGNGTDTSSEQEEMAITPEFDEEDNLELPISFIYKGDRFLQGKKINEANEEAQEAILTKLLNMMGEE